MNTQQQQAHERLLRTLPVRTYSRMKDEPPPGHAPPKRKSFVPHPVRYRGVNYPSIKAMQRKFRCSQRKILVWLAKGQARYL